MSVLFAGRLNFLVLAVLFTSTFAQQKYRAVNLGGWLVLEQFITPNLFRDIPDKKYQTEADVSNKRPDEVKNHHITFVTEEDFKYLNSHGINAVRIPVGWWITQPGTPPYVDGSLDALDRAFDWGLTHGIKIIVDLHSARGSQNMDGHSGSHGKCKWADPKHVTETVNDIGFLAKRYANRPALLGIELLNEPNNQCVSRDDLKKYYTRGYNEVRKYTAEAYVIFSLLLGDYNGDPSDLVPHNQKNVVLDVHLYSWFDGEPCRSKSAQANIDCIHRDREAYVNRLIMNANKAGALVLVGEWTDAFKAEDPTPITRKKFSQAQQEVYGKASFGWAYWTLKHSNTDRNFRYWSFQYAVDDGVF